MKYEVYEAVYEHEARHWWYRVRRLLAAQFVKDAVTTRGATAVLDVGCGTGALMKELEQYAEVTGVDMSSTAVQYCKSRGLDRVYQGTLPNLPFEDSMFDVVLALDVLEHVQDDLSATKELQRVLKPGGTAIIFVPAFDILWGNADVEGQHYRRYRKGTLFEVLKGGGFDIVRSTYFNTFLFLPILSVRLLFRMYPHAVVDEFRTGSRPVNAALYAIFRVESMLLRWVPFPFGVSVMAICRKPR